MKEILVDTNVFLRFLLNDIPQQTVAAKALFKKAKEGKVLLIVPQIVVFEIEFILDKYYLVPKEERMQQLGSLISMDYLQVQDANIFQKALQIFAVNTFSLVDSFLLAKAEEEEKEFFTFDQAVLKVSKKS